jgi:HEAT repeat protein
VLPVPAQDKAKASDAAVKIKKLSDQEARTAVAAFKKSARDKEARLAQRVEAVQQLGTGRHELLVKPLAKTVEADRSITVRKKAAELLGHQPPKEARRAIVRLIDDPDDLPPEVLAALIRSLSSAGYESRDWKHIEDLFDRDFDEKHTAVQKAILELVTKHVEKQAWKLLVEHIDEPYPDEVDSGDNPPAEYWEQRWKAWRVWRSDAREALFVITGQRFSSKEEAKAWIRENGTKVGLK